MAFDGIAATTLQDGPHTLVVPGVRSARRGGDIALHDRIALTVGYGAFGLGVGAAAALVLRRLQPDVVTTLVAICAVGAAVLGIACIRLVHRTVLPLVGLVALAAAWAIASSTLFDRPTDILPAIALFAAALPATGIVSGRKFSAAFAVALLGMTLAAPVGAASMLSIFG